MEIKSLLREHARKIYEGAIKECLPNKSVERAINESFIPKGYLNRGGKIILVAIGKASWEMANTAYCMLKDKIDLGIVITKYNHSRGQIGNLEIYEASHPVVDENGILATKRAIELTSSLNKNDVVLMLISGGGSALFEDISCPIEKMQDITEQLLKSGASINEINAIRKHLSNVKGGRFAQHIYPASAFAIALSDVIGDDVSTIASGPVCSDNTTVENCLEIIEKYGISVDKATMELIKRETPKEITNSEIIVSGSVNELCQSAEKIAQELGYMVQNLGDKICSEAWKIAYIFGQRARNDHNTFAPLAFIMGGEITIKVRGNGKGGRNQELALLSAKEIDGYKNVAVFSVGSDGTDGPTDAAGGYVDGESWRSIIYSGLDPESSLRNNDSYNALNTIDGLIFTGPTGTNVNDLYVMLIQPDEERSICNGLYRGAKGNN